jgi:hypothetical protein
MKTLEIAKPLNQRLLFVIAMAAALSLSAAGGVKKQHPNAEAGVESTDDAPKVLWRNPTDIESRNLFYGPGGKAHEPPRGVYTFVKEDLDGSNPKFVVRDQNGVKWKVKLGEEARPETAATRLVWAAGYFANEDYFLGTLRVEKMPAHLHRGQNRVSPDHSVHDVRLKRESKKEDKTGTWKWRRDPFTGTHELNGLRVVMAMINNWDLKDENNAIYEETAGARETERIYMISDLGASFGTPGPSWPHSKSKGNLESYARSKFIQKLTPEYVDFHEPARPSYHYLLNIPEYFRRRSLGWIGKRVPRSDARRMGQLLARLSPDQIRDAFRAAGYSPAEVAGFAAVVEQRIAALKAL